MAATPNQPASEPAYKKWATIVGSVVAALSLLFNIILGVSNFRLSNEKTSLETALTRRRTAVDLEVRYLVVSGLAMFDLRANAAEGENLEDQLGPAAVVQNQVFQDFLPWLSEWGSGAELISEDEGIQRAHGIVLLRISNRGEQDAHEVLLVAKAREFSAQGDAAENLWELDTREWQDTTIRLADLEAGESVTIPLAHVLGTRTYFDHVVMPIHVEWYNSTLQVKESTSVQTMAPEDQWISAGLNIKVGQ